MLVAATLAAQGTPPTRASERRAPLVGVVQSADGVPVAGAFVHLVTRELPESETVGDGEVVTVRTDERGGFRADVRADVELGVFAWGVVGGRDVVTERVAAVSGVPLTLIATARATVRDLRFVGAGARAAAGARLRVQIDGRQPFSVEVDVGADGTASLPPLPPTALRWLLLRDGRLLHAGVVEPIGERVDLALPATQRLRFVVHEMFGGGPAANVVVERRAFEWTFECARTDALGVAEVDVPLDAALGDWAPAFARLGLGLRGVGRRPILVRPDADRRVPAVRAMTTSARRDGAVIELRVGVEPGPEWSGVVTGDGGVAMGGITLLVHGMHGHVERVTTDAAGAFAVVLPQDFGRGRVIASVPGHGEALVAVTHDLVRGGRVVIALDRLSVLRVRVVSADGLPAPGVPVVLREGVAAGAWPGAPLQRRADRLGRAAFVVPRSVTFEVAAGGAGSVDHATAASSQAPTIDVGLRLCQARVLRGVVRGGGGEGVADVPVQLSLASARALRPDVPIARVLRAVALLPEAEAARTNAEGRFALPVPEVFGVVGIAAGVGAAALRARTIVATADGTWPTVELDVAGK